MIIIDIIPNIIIYTIGDIREKDSIRDEYVELSIVRYSLSKDFNQLILLIVIIFLISVAI